MYPHIIFANIENRKKFLYYHKNPSDLNPPPPLIYIFARVKNNLWDILPCIFIFCVIEINFIRLNNFKLEKRFDFIFIFLVW